MLCKRLASGGLDVAFVSSFEFLRNPIYRIVDDVSISSAGPVYSVVVAHRGDISKVDEIQLDPAAGTSTNLLRCLLAERGLSPRLILTSTSSVVEPRVPTRRNSLRLGTAASTPNAARLLIGDQAIHFRERHPDFEFWDLGEQWNKVVGLPFVYALWLVRPEVVDSKPIANRLRGLRDKNLAGIDELIAEEKEFDRKFCRRYYRENLRFGFGQDEKAGLREFHKRCLEQRLLPREHLKPGDSDSRLPFRCV